VVAKLDIRRPQVLVEALIMEVKVSDTTALGFSAMVETFNGNTSGSGGSISGPTVPRSAGDGEGIPDDGDDNLPPDIAKRLTNPALGGGPTFFGAFTRDDRDENGQGTLIQALIVATAGNSDTNIVASPHILTTDNEEAEIKIGQNIPIITSSQQNDEITSVNRVNVERQDIGVTLRVTPQISEGDSLRLEIYQEITKVADTSQSGKVSEVGPTLLNRSVDNTVVVKDGQTVVIGGLLDEVTTEGIRKVPFLGDIPFLGWLFKTTTSSVDKTNLLIFLTPHIVRSPEDMEMETIRKREEFRYYSKQDEDVDKRLVEELGVDLPDRTIDPARRTLDQLDKKYPLERYKDLEALKLEAHEKRMRKDAQGQVQYMLLAAVYEDETLASETLTQLVDGGYDGTLTAEDAGGSILYRIVLGPYDDLTGAELTAATVREVFGLTPTVLLEHLEPEQPEL
jgi:general secretion pathway protein D